MIFNFIISLILVLGGNSGIEKKVEKYLNNKLAGYQKFEYKIKSLPKSYGNSELRINEKKEFKLRGKYCYIPVIINRGNRDLNSVISVEVNLYDEILVARRDLRKGENLSRADFNIQLVDITKYRTEPISINTPVEFFRVKRSVRQGTVLTADKIEGIPVIKKGDRIMANLIQGSIIIQMEAYARQDGLIGERIRISADKKYFEAEVIDSYNVKIVE